MTPEQQAAALALADLDPSAWYDQATAFGCFEADTLAQFLSAFVNQDTADAFLADHACGDDDGDEHRPTFDARGVVIGYTRNEETGS